MKKIPFFTLLSSILLLSSCSNKLADNELSGHLLLGPFSTAGKSGDMINQKLESLANVSDEELIKGYKELFAFPYPVQMAPQAQAILLKDFNATDKTSAIGAINVLMEESKSGDHKAYTYSLAVNVANLAYSSGYFTQKDVTDYEQKVLIEAKINYSNWDKYLNDFLKGRENKLKDDPNSSQQLYEVIVHELFLKNKNSPYLKLEFAF